MHRVLVVGEDTTKVQAMVFRLGLLGFETFPSASESSLALRSVFTQKPDAIILDSETEQRPRQLFQLLEEVSQLPIIVLADGRDDDLVWYLEHGAADYLARPVGLAHLSARLRAVLRRSCRPPGDGVLAVGDLEIDLERHQVRRDGRAIPVTPTEFRLLQVLAERRGQACSHRLLLERVWGEEFGHCLHYLRLYIGYLRQKLERDPHNPRLLVTEWGVGYRLIEERARDRLPQRRPIGAAVA
ncbi:MAG TPA: response regulator transcription factor [Dehalococcoidia bacterium]|nr:response regulator transcription factor [Dehalococcoidia bacterium]